MIVLKASSLERYLSLNLCLLALPLPLLLALWAHSEGFSPWLIIVCETLLLLFLWRFIVRFRRRVLMTFDRAARHLEAINQEDYNQWAKSIFSQGKVAAFHQQLVSLSFVLREKKSRYDQHVFLVYQLIEQLETPMLAFNAKQQLTFGNAAFADLYHQPWQMCQSVSPAFLGLEWLEGGWQFTDKNRNRQWQIRQSEFIEAGESYQLLVFINIESALRKSQLDAWQQIIRVLSHEIRNSLTPVSSLAESLATRAGNERDKMALEVITGRCQHLQDFVSRYASLSKKLDLTAQWIVLSSVIKRVSGLFKGFTIEAELSDVKIWADVTFIEQVFINLIKNANEANATEVQLSVSEVNQQSVIKVVDDGDGFANLDNLFIPLYTTKPQGQGIGLSFCRNIIEQHEGTFELSNNQQRGVTVTIQLPLPLLNL